MLETFHALLIKITYTAHIHADFHIGSCSRSCHPSTHQSNKAPIEVTLSNCLSKKNKKNDVGYAKKRGKRKEIKACSKAWFGHMKVQEKISKAKESHTQRPHTRTS
jgi:hypothetical protein